MILTGHDQQVAAWIADRIRDVPTGDMSNCSTMGVIRHGKLVAALAYWFWPNSNCEIAMAADSPSWATKETVYTLLAYPFIQADCRRMTALVRPKNQRVRKLAEGIGFKLEGKLRRFSKDGKDLLVYGYLQDEFKRSKWCELRKGLKSERHSAAA